MASSVPPAILDNSNPAQTSQEDLHQSGPLTSFTSDLLSICPRFRVLVIGNSGVGKSTLIRKVFGVTDVKISNDGRGQADIEREFIAKENDRFVVHDGLGLEAGEGDNLDKIKQFVRKRRAMKDIKDRLHAVWVCLPVPYAKGRLLETGMEKFLRERKAILDDIPIVVVLTKVDILNQQLLFDLSKKGSVKSLEEALVKVELEKPKFLEEYCAKPLRAIPGDIRHVAVSVRDGHESTIPPLVKTTTSEIEHYITGKIAPNAGTERKTTLELNAPLYLAGMAQRVSIEVNIALTIKLGKKKLVQLNSLSAALHFSEAKVQEYFRLMHEDIVQVWNLYDPEGFLRGDDFQARLLNIEELGADGAHDPKGTSDSEDDVIHTLAEIIGTLIKIPLALPKAVAKAGKKFAKVSESSQFRISCFMTYITNFVYVMKILFILSPQGPITSNNAELAIEVYEKSSYRNRIHLEIRDFTKTNPIFPSHDTIMGRIEQMVGRYDITDDGVAELRKKILEKKKMTP